VDEDFPGGSFLFGPEGALLAESGGPEEMLLICEARL
jgi:predicted amidohydrolase